MVGGFLGLFWLQGSGGGLRDGGEVVFCMGFCG